MSRYDPATALIVVDMQNDFADPAGSLSVAGGEEIVPTVDGEIAKATVAGALVIFTQDWHPKSTAHFAKDGRGPPPGPRRARGRPAHPQGRQRGGRLFRLHDARPDDRP